VTGPSFRFRLERVRTVRKHTEDVAAGHLLAARLRAQESERDLELAQRRIEDARLAAVAAPRTPVSGAELAAMQVWLECAERALATVAETHQRDEREVDARRDELTVAARKRKALDRLEMRRRDEFDREAARVESRTLDEIALAPHGGRAA